MDIRPILNWGRIVIIILLIGLVAYTRTSMLR